MVGLQGKQIQNMVETVITLYRHITFAHISSINIILQQREIVQLEYEGSACLRLQLLLVAIEIGCKTIQFCLVQDTEMFLNGSLGVQSGSDKEIGTDGILHIPSFGHQCITDRKVAHQFEVVQRIAIEYITTLAALELELAVNVYQATKQTQLGTHLAGEV